MGKIQEIREEIAHLCRRYNRLAEINNGFDKKIKDFQYIRNAASRRHNWAVSDDYDNRIDSLFSRWNGYSVDQERISAKINGAMDAFRIFGYEITLYLSNGVGFSGIAQVSICETETGNRFRAGIFDTEPGEHLYCISIL